MDQDGTLPIDTTSGQNEDTELSMNVGGSYILSRNYASTTRLNSQHLLWKLELGWCLHPSLQALMTPHHQKRAFPNVAATTVTASTQGSNLSVARRDTVRIADLATGTAIWAIDVSHEFPLALIDGFDIHLQQCPPPEWLPFHVTVRQWDIYSAMPPELEGLYDVVHIRLLLLVVRDNDPRPILRNAFRMLKRGGCLQWDELDPWGAITVVAGQPRGDETGENFQKRQELTPMDTLNWVLELHSIMEEVGFEDVKKEDIACDLRLAKYYQDMQFMVMEEQAAAEATAEGKERVGKAIRDGVGESYGKARVTPKMVVLGRKPARQHQAVEDS
ncbi:MAG: hypothetical protein Q9224_001690 [Gallowayella concinna]